MSVPTAETAGVQQVVPQAEEPLEDRQVERAAVTAAATENAILTQEKTLIPARRTVRMEEPEEKMVARVAKWAEQAESYVATESAITGRMRKIVHRTALVHRPESAVARHLRHDHPLHPQRPAINRYRLAIVETAFVVQARAPSTIRSARPVTAMTPDKSAWLIVALRPQYVTPASNPDLQREEQHLHARKMIVLMLTATA